MPLIPAHLLQVFFYCLDALPILLTFLVFIVLPYGKYLPDQSLMLEHHQQLPRPRMGGMQMARQGPKTIAPML